LHGYLQRNDLPTEAAAIGPEEIRAFILDLMNSKRYQDHPNVNYQESRLSRQTINSYLRASRAAWNRWVANGLVESSPFAHVKLPKVQKKVIPTFNTSQIAEIMNVIDKSTPEGYRDYVLILLYLDTACRLSEITNLKVDDVDMKRRTIKVTGKGQMERVVPIGAKVLKALWKYINRYRATPLLPKYNHVFLTREGKPLSKNRVEAIVKKYGKKAKITGVRCSPHTLRHTACLFWIRNHGDLFSLQQITGHSSLEVLRGYVNLAQSDVREAHRKYSPVDNLEI
jgi:integrase/recombinase XerD